MPNRGQHSPGFLLLPSEANIQKCGALRAGLLAGLAWPGRLPRPRPVAALRVRTAFALLGWLRLIGQQADTLRVSQPVRRGDVPCSREESLRISRREPA